MEAQPERQVPDGDDSLSEMTDYAEAVNAQPVERTSSEQVYQGMMEVYQGPTIPPKYCRDYDELVPGFAQQYLTEVINETKHRRELELREIGLKEKELSLTQQQIDFAAKLEFDDNQIRRRGQAFGFGVVLSAYLLAGGALLLKFEAAAIAIAGSTTAGLAAVFVTGKLKESKDPEDKQLSPQADNTPTS